MRVRRPSEKPTISPRLLALLRERPELRGIGISILLEGLIQ